MFMEGRPPRCLQHPLTGLNSVSLAVMAAVWVDWHVYPLAMTLLSVAYRIPGQIFISCGGSGGWGGWGGTEM